MENLVQFNVAEHNTHLPHSAFRGQTPDEIYFGTNEDIPGQLKESRATAQSRTRPSPTQNGLGIGIHTGIPSGGERSPQNRHYAVRNSTAISSRNHLMTTNCCWLIQPAKQINTNLAGSIADQSTKTTQIRHKICLESGVTSLFPTAYHPIRPSGHQERFTNQFF